jgi:hypothetical protein
MKQQEQSLKDLIDQQESTIDTLHGQLHTIENVIKKRINECLSVDGLYVCTIKPDASAKTCFTIQIRKTSHDEQNL